MSTEDGISENGFLIAPWRNATKINEDGTITYYAPHPPSSKLPCLPKSSNLKFLTRYTTTHPTQHTPTHLIPIPKPILLIINPHAGTASKTTLRTALSHITQILRDAALNPILLYTKHPLHAVQLLAEYPAADLTALTAILSVGGDGTLHEILNGLLQNAHANSLDLSNLPPLAVIPLGSGNAIAISTRLLSPIHAALNVIHALRLGLARPMAVLQYRRNGSDERKLLVCGVQWGLPADVDCGTEKWRFMGDTRFDIAAVLHIIAKRRARARIRISVDMEKHRAACEGIRDAHVDGAHAHVAQELEMVDESTYLLDGEFNMFVAWNAEYIGDGFMVTPHASVTETGVFDIIVFPAGISRIQMLSVLLSVQDGSFIRKSRRYHYFKATRVVFEQIAGRYLTIDGEPVPVEPFTLEMAPEDAQLRLLDAFSST